MVKHPNCTDFCRRLVSISPALRLFDKLNLCFFILLDRREQTGRQILPIKGRGLGENNTDLSCEPIKKSRLQILVCRRLCSFW